MRYLYQAQPDLEVVVCEDDEAIVDAIDERTLLVPISHVLFKTAVIQDVEPIVRRAHEVGAHVILDCYQSAGIVPVDVTALGVDFAVGGSVKWLCGGPGNGWLYVRPDLAERLTPTFTGWQAHETPFGFEEEMRYAERRRALPHRDAERPRPLRRHRRLRPDRGDRRRPHPRELAPADAAPHRPRRRGGLRGAEPARRGTARRDGHRPRPRLPGRPPGARPSARSSATSGPTPESASARTTTTPTTSSGYVVAQIGEILETGAHERHLGVVAQH